MISTTRVPSTKERIERLVREATELTFDRCNGEAQRNIHLWLHLHHQIENKMAQAEALRKGKPVPDDLPAYQKETK